MSTTWLEVARPGGRADDLHDLARQIRHGAASIDHLRRPLDSSAELATSRWSGLAAYAFHHQHGLTRASMARVSALHDDAAAIIESYAERLAATQNTAERAVDQMHDALDQYTAQARAAFQQIAGMLRSALDNPVVELVGDVFPVVEQIVDRILSWQPPTHQAPVAVCRAEPSDHVSSSAIDVVLNATEWGVARLLDGLDAAASIVGHVIDGAVSLVKRAEDFLSRAIAAAQDLARRAFEALVEFGKACARKIAEIARAAYEVGCDLVTGIVNIARSIWDESGNVIEQWLKQKFGVRNMQGTYALTHYPPHSRDKFNELKDLADRAYQANPDAGNDRISRDWRRLTPKQMEDLGITPTMLDDGRGGFYAAVYYNADTGQYVIAFRGSQSGTDWLGHNPDNLVGFTTDQGRRAVALAMQLAQNVDPSMITATGHSTGGALAAMAAVATGAQAVTYNAAGVGQGNLDHAVDAGGGRASGPITNYVSPHDPLTISQTTTVGSDALGVQITTDTTPIPDLDANPIQHVLDGHALDTMLYPGSLPV